MAKFIQHQLFYPHPAEQVWDYLTKSELLEQWLMPNNFRPSKGHEFQFRIKPMPELNFDGIVYCKVLEITPFSKLSYSWQFGPGDGTLHNSLVSWTLTPRESGTELLLVHNGFDESTEIVPIFEGMNKGWLSNMQKILRLINETIHGTTQA
jgi:uncharacterized protein YndB with AHSA1/START domain